ncbi:MAG: DUF63 family protein [Methanocalculaceae archaeon]|jgi:uncharacterized membrane protein|nr:DUF63 family protein [Methanocalculaceae archaeon]
MFNEIGAFIQKYYIDAVLEDQPYNIYLTITCAILLLVTLYLLYRWVRANNIRVDTQLILASMPFVVFGGVLRVVEDTGCIPEPWWVLFVTPPIFFVVLLYTILVLVLSRTLEKHGVVASYTKPYFWVGVVSNLVCLAFLCWWGVTRTELALWVAGCILVIAVVAAFLFWALLRYGFRWEYVTHPLYKILIFGQLLDASATSFALDLHPMHYIEQHVLGDALIQLTGTAFVMFPLKMAVLIPAIWILEMFRKEEGMAEIWHLVLLAMITVGFAPGVRDILRMVLFI